MSKVSEFTFTIHDNSLSIELPSFHLYHQCVMHHYKVQNTNWVNLRLEHFEYIDSCIQYSYKYVMDENIYVEFNEEVTIFYWFAAPNLHTRLPNARHTCAYKWKTYRSYYMMWCWNITVFFPFFMMCNVHRPVRLSTQTRYYKHQNSSKFYSTHAYNVFAWVNWRFICTWYMYKY